MIGFGFLSSSVFVEKAMNDMVQKEADWNLTEKEQKILNFLNDQLQNSVKSSSRQCPECQDYFHVLQINNIEIDCCKKCESLWFDPKELQIVMNTDNDMMKDALHAGKSKYKCPVCQTKLQQRSFLFPERLVVDICPDGHGVYFEKGELEKAFKAS